MKLYPINLDIADKPCTILGALFRNHRKSKTESELIIFVTAHVLGGNANETLPDKP